MFGEHSRKTTIRRTLEEDYDSECVVPTLKYGPEGGGACDGLGSNIVIQYSVGFIITLHGRITAREFADRLVNQMPPGIETFPKNDAVPQDESDGIHTAGTVQSWFEKQDSEL
jgi:hypothetical protein